METMHSENISNQPVLFEVEAVHDEPAFYEWMNENWALGVSAATAYAVVIFTGKQYMENRPRFELRYLLALWSGALAIFSILGTIRTVPQFVEDIYDHGFHYSVCDNSYLVRKPTSFWCYLFTISKIYELGDTVFIVLRKQPLIFLHYYHHITVLLYVWYSYPQRIASGRWFMILNFFVHSLMYSYYTLRALRFKVPRFVNIVITFLQLMQMVIGFTINIYVSQVLMNGNECATSWENFKYSTAMYISYFILFAKFFYDTYVRPKPAKKEDKCNDVQNGHAHGEAAFNAALRGKKEK